jgi:hypothetical protein
MEDEDSMCQYRNSYFTYKKMEWEYVWFNTYDGFNRDSYDLSAEVFEGVLIAKDNVHTFDM